MLRVALRPRFLGLLALMVAATVVCGLLATWQWDRAQRALQAQTDGPAALGRIQDVTAVGDAVTNEKVGGIVTAEGSFDPSQQVVVTGRRIDGVDAVIIVSALHVPEPDGTTALLPVARGWVPAGEVMNDDGSVRTGDLPAAPSGAVRLEGRLEASEAASGGVVDGVAPEIATPLLVNLWGGPMYAGYVAQTSPADGLRPMPVATSEFRAGLNWQNVGYALQWVLFGAFFLYLWWRSVRSTHLDELADQRDALRAALEDRADADSAAGDAEPAASSSASAPAAGPDVSASASVAAAGPAASASVPVPAADAPPRPVGPDSSKDPRP